MKKILVILLLLLLFITSGYYFFNFVINLLSKNSEEAALDSLYYCAEGRDHNYEVKENYPLVVPPIFSEDPLEHNYSSLKQQMDTKTDNIKEYLYGNGDFYWQVTQEGHIYTHTKNCNTLEGYGDDGYYKKDQETKLSEQELKKVGYVFVDNFSEWLGKPNLASMTIDVNNQDVLLPQTYKGYQIENGKISISFFNGKIWAVKGHWWNIPDSFLTNTKNFTYNEIVKKINGRLIRSGNLDTGGSQGDNAHIYYFKFSDKKVINKKLVLKIYEGYCNNNIQTSKNTARLIWSIDFKPIYDLKTSTGQMYLPNFWTIDVDAITGEVMQVSSYIKNKDFCD